MITEASIYVSNYQETLSFYHDLFQTTVTENSSNQFKLELEWNTLTLSEVPTNEQPYYHFAFLVPYDLFDEAKQYVSKHVPLNIQEGKDEISFKKGIRSFYFYDPSGNVLEFITKDNHYSSSNQHFSPESIIGLTEMSLVTDSLDDIASKLFQAGILKKDPKTINKDFLTFISSEETTLLLSPVGRTWVFSDKQADVFPQTIIMDDIHIKVDQKRQVNITKC